MDFMPLQIFHRAVECQCKFALRAYEDLKQAAANYRQPPPACPTINYEDAIQRRLSEVKDEQWQAELAEHQQRQAVAKECFWYSIQALLVAVGNISKLLWPSEKAILPERGPELRASLAVEEDSPLKPRTFRNHLEHYDERLDQWAVSSRPRVFIDGNIALTGMISGTVPEDYLRNFDHRNFAFTFRGKSYPLLPIVEAIEQLRDKATVRLQQRASA